MQAVPRHDSLHGGQGLAVRVSLLRQQATQGVLPRHRQCRGQTTQQEGGGRNLGDTKQILLEAVQNPICMSSRSAQIQHGRTSCGHNINASQEQLSMAGCLAPLQEHGDATPSKWPIGRDMCRHASASKPLHAAILGRGEMRASARASLTFLSQSILCLGGHGLSLYYYRVIYEVHLTTAP